MPSTTPHLLQRRACVDEIGVHAIALERRQRGALCIGERGDIGSDVERPRRRRGKRLVKETRRDAART